MSNEKTRTQKAMTWMVMCGTAWFVLGFYGFWGMAYNWAPALLCVTLLSIAWALFAAAIILAIVAGTPTKAEVDERKRVKAQESFIREQTYRQLHDV